MRGLATILGVMVAAIFAGGMGEALAQAVGAPPGGGLADAFPFKLDANSLTTTGVLAWYAWHNTARAIPDILKQHTEANKATQERFTAELSDARKTFQDQLATVMHDHREDSLGVTKGLAELANSVSSLQASISSRTA